MGRVLAGWFVVIRVRMALFGELLLLFDLEFYLKIISRVWFTLLAVYGYYIPICLRILYSKFNSKYLLYIMYG